MLTFTYEDVPITALHSAALRSSAARAGGWQAPVEAYRINLVASTGSPTHMYAECLYYPDFGRLGIAWNGVTTWAEVDSIEAGIEMWLNSPGEWAAAGEYQGEWI